MNKVQFENVGFRRPVRHARPLTPRKVAFANLIMTVALVMSIAVAATAVSFGIARADDLTSAAPQDPPIAEAVLIGGALAITGVVAAAMMAGGVRRAPRD